MIKNEIPKGVIYQKEDFELLLKIYKDYLKINEKIELLSELGDNIRRINLPECISEGLYSYIFGSIRINGTGAGSADLIDIIEGEHYNIQVKSTTIENDLTSFGPKSTWDKLVFMDFSVKNFISIYDLTEINIYDIVLNKSLNETFKNQQERGIRPRLSLKKLINNNNIEPIINCKVVDINNLYTRY